MPVAATRAFLFVTAVATLTAVQEQLSLMITGHSGDEWSGRVPHLPPLSRFAMVLSCLCYSAVGVVYGHVGDDFGEALFLVVGVASAVADADLLADTPLAK